MNENFFPIIAFIFGALGGVAFMSWRTRLLMREAALEKDVLKEKLNLSQRLHHQFAEQFKGLSAEALRQNQDSFLQLASKSFEAFHQKSNFVWEKKEQAMAHLIAPMKESLEKFDGKIQELEKARLGAYVGLKEQIQSLLDTQRQLKDETSQLVKALRAPVVRGRWGEIQLKRVVEMAGMLDHCDFYEQEVASEEDRRYRPDLVVRLPGEKNIVIDAKAPLEAYLEAIETQDEDKKKQKFRDHAGQIRSHIIQLGRKSYWDQFQPSPDFVVLFLPGETFFSSALEHDPSLIEAGVDQKVILATPTTLIALLRAVSYGWRQEKLSQSAEQIGAMGKDLYKRICDMASHWTKLGKSLGASVEAFNKAVGSLETRVLVSARRFKEFDWVGIDREIEPLEPLEHVPRSLMQSLSKDEEEPNDEENKLKTQVIASIQSE